MSRILRGAIDSGEKQMEPILGGLAVQTLHRPGKICHEYAPGQSMAAQENILSPVIMSQAFAVATTSA